MKKYEVVFILEERQVADQGKAFADELTSLVGSLGGKVTETLPMGRRQFSRKIKRRKSGIYWDFVVEVDESKAEEIKNKYRLDERILRMQIFEYEERVSTGAKKLLEPDLSYSNNHV